VGIASGKASEPRFQNRVRESVGATIGFRAGGRRAAGERAASERRAGRSPTTPTRRTCTSLVYSLMHIDRSAAPESFSALCSKRSPQPIEYRVTPPWVSHGPPLRAHNHRPYPINECAFPISEVALQAWVNFHEHVCHHVRSVLCHSLTAGRFLENRHAPQFR